MATITIRTRSFNTSTSRTATRAEGIGDRYGVHTRHTSAPDRFDRTATRHTVTLTADRTILEILSPELQRLGVRPRIMDDNGSRT